MVAATADHWVKRRRARGWRSLLRKFYRPTGREWLEARHPQLKAKHKAACDLRRKCEKLRLLADVSRKRASLQLDHLGNLEAVFLAQVDLRDGLTEGECTAADPSPTGLGRPATVTELLETVRAVEAAAAAAAVVVSSTHGHGSVEGGNVSEETESSVASVADSPGTDLATVPELMVCDPVQVQAEPGGSAAAAAAAVAAASGTAVASPPPGADPVVAPTATAPAADAAVDGPPPPQDQKGTGTFLDKIAGLWRWQGVSTPDKTECPHGQPALTLTTGAR